VNGVECSGLRASLQPATKRRAAPAAASIEIGNVAPFLPLLAAISG